MSEAPSAACPDRPGLRGLLRRLMTEQLEPGRAAAAVALGITLGIVPIYGLQSVVALALATLFRLNRPLTLAGTFINIPPIQPLLVIGSLQLGHLAMGGTLVSLSPRELLATGVGLHVVALFIGSVILSAAVGGSAGLATYVVLRRRAARADLSRNEARRWRRHVNRIFATAPIWDRGFVRWKTRLDRLFDLLLAEELGTGPVVDLGCGHGAGLALVAFRDPHRVLYGCDLSERRIQAARRALSGYDARISVADVRTFEIPEAGLILVLDVLQYIGDAEQAALLARCAAALSPGGLLILRAPDTDGGLLAKTTAWLDRLALGLGAAGTAPAGQPARVYQRLLAEAGLSVTAQRYPNKLPLAHVVLRARKPDVAA